MALDRTQLDKLISDLESGADALARATDVNTTAQAAAAKAEADLSAAQKANTANVAALKAFVGALDGDGNDPQAPPQTPPQAPTPNPTPAGGATAAHSGDSGAAGSPSDAGTPNGTPPPVAPGAVDPATGQQSPLGAVTA